VITENRERMMDLTNADVADILALLDSLPYESLDLETARFRLTLRRDPGGGWTGESRVLAEPSGITAAPQDAPAPPGGEPDVTEISDGAAPAGAVNGLAAVAAPLPGTFYRAPRPGADPFVRVGDVVSPDTVVAIIETMKLMNSVPAGTAGRVSRVCLENGEFAAAGATLMLIEPGA
jgi:acetyl-CoA carboxylase biotin carboxyl carrier protein